MLHAAPIWPSVETYVTVRSPDEPVFLFAPAALTAQARRFLDGFPGLVTYAVKANPDRNVLMTLVAAGVEGFDVASPEEIRLVRALAPHAALHYHNPVKSRDELRFAHAHGVRTYSLDSFAELDKIADVLPAAGVELSIRFRAEARGAAYDFGAKFGASEDLAAALMARAAELGFDASLTFHPGTQCLRPEAWREYIEMAARIARAAGVRPKRLNVGGGFPARRANETVRLQDFFDEIASAARRAFDGAPPALVCEPGRGLVTGCMALLTRVKLIREDGAAFLNDGVYGGLAEAPLLGSPTAMRALDPEGRPRAGAPRPTRVFGPTCDSVDALPGAPELPEDLAEGDYVLFSALGAYGGATATRFNGYGPTRVESVAELPAM